MTFEVIELGIGGRVPKRVHSRDRFARAFEIASMCATKRVTVLDQRFHEREGLPMRNVRNLQLSRGSPIVALENITRRDRGQRVSAAELKLRICFPNLCRK